MWNAFKNTFERHALLNKTDARRKFYTVRIENGDRNLAFTNLIKQLAFALQFMDGPVDEAKMPLLY